MRNESDYSDVLLKAQNIVSEGILIFNSKKEGMPLEYVNNGFLVMTGFSGKELLGRSHQFLQEKDSDPDNLKKFVDSFTGKVNCNVDLILSKKNGDKFYSRVSVTPIPDNTGSIDYYLCIVRDITDSWEKLLNQMKLSVMRKTLRSYYDIVLNFMIGMYFFRIECEESKAVSKENLEKFDSDYHETLKNLRDINDFNLDKESELSNTFSILA